MSFANLYFSAKGRIGRKTYILGALPLLAAMIAAAIMDEASGRRVFLSYGAFQLGAVLLTLWPMICLGIKRLHDRNRSGWFILLGYVPLVNIWIAIELLFLRGSVGENKYGQEPVTRLEVDKEVAR